MRDIPRRRGWAPFVGVALAALTAGSLITFSVVAQRTSLDGMSDDGVIAASPAAVQPPSITIAPLGGAGQSETGGEPGVGTTPAAPFLIVGETPLGPTTVTATDDDGSTLAPRSTAQRLGGPLAAENAFLARHGGGGQPDARGESELARYDERHDGKHTHKSHEVKAKSKKSNSKKSKNSRSKKAKGSARDGRGAGRDRGPRHSGGNSPSGRSQSNGSAAPAKRSSSQKARPAPSAKKSSPSKQPGAKSKARGRGRGRG